MITPLSAFLQILAYLAYGPAPVLLSKDLPRDTETTGEARAEREPERNKGKTGRQQLYGGKVAQHRQRLHREQHGRDDETELFESHLFLSVLALRPGSDNFQRILFAEAS